MRRISTHAASTDSTSRSREPVIVRSAAAAGRSTAGRPQSVRTTSTVSDETRAEHVNDSILHRTFRRTARVLPWSAALVVLVLLCALTTTVRADGVHVALIQDTTAVSPLPDTLLVQPGDPVNLQLYVTEPGRGFNAYDAVISFDPTALTFLPTSPLSLQEGAYMKGACGNTFHYFLASYDSLTISHSLLCRGDSLLGPGQLYRLHFQAQDVAQGTWVHIRHIQFYNAGKFADPAYASDTYVAIGIPLGVPGGGTPPPGLTLRVVPNPSRAATGLLVQSDRAGEQCLDIFDPAGRLVRRLERGDFGPGPRRVAWDGRDDAGRAVTPGVYQVVIRASGRLARARVVLLP